MGNTGASADHDGEEGVAHIGANQSNVPVEMIEAEYPIRIEHYGIMPDTGEKYTWVAPDGRTHNPCSVDGCWAMARVGKKRAGRDLDGRTWDEFPRVRTDA